jgi:hypothetical protein
MKKVVLAAVLILALSSVAEAVCHGKGASRRAARQASRHMSTMGVVVTQTHTTTTVSSGMSMGYNTMPMRRVTLFGAGGCASGSCR